MQFDKILTEEVRKKTTDSVCFNLKLRKERKFTQIELFNQALQNYFITLS